MGGRGCWRVWGEDTGGWGYGPLQGWEMVVWGQVAGRGDRDGDSDRDGSGTDVGSGAGDRALERGDRVRGQRQGQGDGSGTGAGGWGTLTGAGAGHRGEGTGTPGSPSRCWFTESGPHPPGRGDLPERCPPPGKGPGREQGPCRTSHSVTTVPSQERCVCPVEPRMSPRTMCPPWPHGRPVESPVSHRAVHVPWSSACPTEPRVSRGPMDVPRSHTCPLELCLSHGPPDVPWVPLWHPKCPMNLRALRRALHLPCVSQHAGPTVVSPPQGSSLPFRAPPPRPRRTPWG